MTASRNVWPWWVDATVMIGALFLLGYNIIVYGIEGYPTSVILGGILGAYAGLRELLNRRSSGGNEK